MPYYFTKLDSTLPDSSVWALDDQTRIVWITMLAMANRFGEVLASVPGLAGRARVSVAKTQEALEKFMSPDEFSRCEDNGGRRLAKITGGWLLLGYKRHRERKDDRDSRAAHAELMRESRAMAPETKAIRAGEVSPCDLALPSVTTGEEKQRQKQKQEVEANEETERESPSAPVSEQPELIIVAPTKPRTKTFIPPTLEEVLARCLEIGLPSDQGEEFFHHYETSEWCVSGIKMKNWRAALSGWKVRWKRGQFAGSNRFQKSRTADHPGTQTRDENAKF